LILPKIIASPPNSAKYHLREYNMPIFKFSRRPNVQELKNQKDVDGLIEALGYKDDHNVRLAAASALGRVGDTRAVDPLIDALDDRLVVKDVAAQALGHIGDRRAVEPLLTALDDEDWEIRSTVAKALGKIGDERAIQPLLCLLKDKYEIVRWHATQALEVITGESFGDDIAKWEEITQQ
jgi:HEAT repeat protein